MTAATCARINATNIKAPSNVVIVLSSEVSRGDCQRVPVNALFFEQTCAAGSVAFPTSTRASGQLERSCALIPARRLRSSPYNAYTRVTTAPAPQTTRAEHAVSRSSYQAEYAEQAQKLCLLLGAADEELPCFFGVLPTTLQEWLVSVPEFAAGRPLRPDAGRRRRRRPSLASRQAGCSPDALVHTRINGR